VPAAFPRLYALEQKYGSLIKGQILGVRGRRKNGETAKNTAPSFSFRAGMQQLTDALARAIARVQTSVQVRRIERNADGTWTVAGAHGGDPVLRRAKAVVFATPAYEAAKLVRELAPAATKGLGAIEYAAIAGVATAYRRADVAHPLAGFGFLVPRKEQRGILGSLFSSSMFEDRAPEGTVLLTSFVGGRRNPEMLGRPDGKLAQIVHGELVALVGARAEPLWTELRWSTRFRESRWATSRACSRSGRRARAPGRSSCASYRGGVAVGDCIKSAHAMADAVTAVWWRPPA
jgi:oxygen-dependent protoporphyrinogen oxidase